MSRTCRCLRIAFSVVCGIACVLLVVLWLRSYWWHDAVTYRNGTSIFGVGARQGGIAFETNFSRQNSGWKIHNTPISKHSRTKPSFYVVDHPTAKGIGLPLWFLVVLFATLAAAPWIRRQFSVRTLLIVMTVIAAMLGLIVVVSR